MDKIKCIITLGFGETLLYKNSKKSKLMLNIQTHYAIMFTNCGKFNPI